MKHHTNKVKELQRRRKAEGRRLKHRKGRATARKLPLATVHMVNPDPVAGNRDLEKRQTKGPARGSKNSTLQCGLEPGRDIKRNVLLVELTRGAAREMLRLRNRAPCGRPVS